MPLTEHDPVEPGEVILRLIPKAYYKPHLQMVIEWVGFKPTDEDTDGLSVSRAGFVTPAELDASGRKPGCYCVVSLKAQDFLDLGLSLTPNPAKTPGHTLVVELSKGNYEANKPERKGVMYELAKIAGQNIVLRPTL